MFFTVYLIVSYAKIDWENNKKLFYFVYHNERTVLVKYLKI